MGMFASGFGISCKIFAVPHTQTTENNIVPAWATTATPSDGQELVQSHCYTHKSKLVVWWALFGGYMYVGAFCRMSCKDQVVCLGTAHFGGV